MLKIRKSAWLLMLLSAALQILIFPLANVYVLGWFALAPLLIALLRTRQPDTLQLKEGIKLLPATPVQAFLLSYVCGIIWYAGTCYWIYNTMRQFGGLSFFAAATALFLFSLYLALYHGLFGLIIGLLASRKTIFQRWALLLSPVIWVAVELARTRITGFPWDLLGTSQVDNIPLSRIATVTGVYGLSFEIMVVNAALAAMFLVRREKRKPLLIAVLGAVLALQVPRWVNPPAIPSDRTATLVQQNVPILEGADWTKEYFDGTLQELSTISLNSILKNPGGISPRLIVWPESPAPFWVSDPMFRSSVTNLARTSQAWVLAGSLGAGPSTSGSKRDIPTYNSASLISPAGDWVARYDKMHLVPFGEYVPFRRLFSFAEGLTQQVGTFTAGTSREPLSADGAKLGIFICYESIFPDEIRQSAAAGAQVYVNISNDGWYGDSGAYAQHLKQVRMRAVENSRWILRDTNTGVTASIDPYGRVVATIPRKIRTVLQAPYALSDVTTFYTRHGDWFAYLCAIISLAALLGRFFFRKEQKP